MQLDLAKLLKVSFAITIPLLCSKPILANPNTECLGSSSPKNHVVYLHGFESVNNQSAEEGQNRKTLDRLAQDLSLRIALPQGPLCDQGKRCWPAQNANQVATTYRDVMRQAEKCWSGSISHSLIGFSNGGYFAWKLYKFVNDPLLTHIIASGSSGTWNPKTDKINPSSSFHLVMGSKDITFHDASHFADSLQGIIPSFSFHKFTGGHRLDYDSLVKILNQMSSKDGKH